ncbi:hypothetical protein ABZX38_21255 [Streptomyces longwoodensis]|uniref:hypothetical protein n=1 Tax=Streptomyces longwoodensis TaxID=68231 RepID=UPI0033B8C025
MHVVIAWWDTRRTAEAGTVRPHPPRPADSIPPDKAPFTAQFPGLHAGQWITDPATDLQGLALIWDSAADANVFLPAIAEQTFGCAPSHRWDFELRTAPTSDEDVMTTPAELELLLHA